MLPKPAHALPGLVASLLLVIAAAGHSATGHAASVKITPLGSHDGEFCARDRALI